MVARLYQWIKKNFTLLMNASSLVFTTAVTSILGFAYWWVAAHHYAPEAVGIASAAVSVMTLLGTFCILGLNTLLITEIPRQPEKAASLISTSIVVVGVTGLVVGAGFALLAPLVSSAFLPLRNSPIDVFDFSAGVALTAIVYMLDAAVIGLLRGELQLWRNVICSTAKVVTIFMAGLLLAQKTGMSIYATWTLSNLFSLLFLLRWVKIKGWQTLRSYLPQWTLIRQLGISALMHHLLNMTLQAPTLILPVLVTILLSAKMNAWFYVAWMIANFVFVVPTALTTVLHAMNSAQPKALGQKVRLTMGIATIASGIASLPLLFATPQVLLVFGHSYADEASWCLRILALAAFPLIIKNHYISICRIHDRIGQAMLSMTPGGVLELVAAAIGARLAGLTGLSLGWVVAICIESLFMLPTILKTIQGKDVLPAEKDAEEYIVAEPIWLIDTGILPVVGQSTSMLEASWRITTHRMPAIKPVKLQKPVSDITLPTTSNITGTISLEEMQAMLDTHSDSEQHNDAVLRQESEPHTTPITSQPAIVALPQPPLSLHGLHQLRGDTAPTGHSSGLLRRAMQQKQPPEEQVSSLIPSEK